MAMTGKIGTDGVLYLGRLRKGKVVDHVATCCYNQDINCSDDCALFGEPYPWDGPNEIRLQLCQDRMLIFRRSGFMDERGGEE